MITLQEAQERVARGAALLDVKVPDWAERIDTSRLRLSCVYNCIRGQLAGGPLWSDCPIGIYDIHSHIDYGFMRDPSDSVDTHQSDYAFLQQCWLAAIAERRAPVVKWIHRAYQEV